MPKRQTGKAAVFRKKKSANSHTTKTISKKNGKDMQDFLNFRIYIVNVQLESTAFLN